MQYFQFDESPVWVIICVLVAALGSWWLYRPVTQWGKNLNRTLAGVRFALILMLTLLLLGPVVRLILNREDAPQVVVLVDDSQSVRLADSAQTNRLLADLPTVRSELESQGFEVSVRGLSGDAVREDFSGTGSDLSGAIRQVETDFDGRNLSAIVLVSDGLFNSGLSPAHSTLGIPVHTLGIGDTVRRMDVQIRSLSYNKVVYQGNLFPLRVDVAGFGLTSGMCRVQVTSKGRVVAREQREFRPGRNFFMMDFQLKAEEPGLRRFEVSVEPVEGESNLQNNRASAMVEVVDGKKKILAVAAAPHPDLSAFRAILEKNEHYEFQIHIPGVVEAPAAMLQPGGQGPDVVIAHQAPDQQGRTSALVNQFLKSGKPMLLVIGQQSDLRALAGLPVPLTFERYGQWDEVFGIPVLPARIFQFPDEAGSVLNRLPPLSAPFGKFTAPADAQPILHQRIGSVNTERLLMFAVARNDQRLGFLTGEGWWRWRMRERVLYDDSKVTDELFLRLIQYLSTTDDKRRFRFFPVQQEFSDTGPVVFEAQIFNEVYQPEYGLPISVEVVSEEGVVQRYSMVPGPSASRLNVSLPEGVYRYTATIERAGRKEADAGSFSVAPLGLESRDLTADYGVLRQLSANSGGRFYSSVTDLRDRLPDDLAADPSPVRLSSEEVFRPLIDWPLIFFALLLLASLEWFLRRYHGGY